MQEVAVFAFLAETAEPMFADDATECWLRWVLVGTCCAQWTVTLFEGFTYRSIGVESESVFPSQEF